METVGYSERGIINALFYEITYSTASESLLQTLLSRVRFPFLNEIIFPVFEAEILIEQSFSDFGDADVLALINTGRHKISIFMEAKIKRSQANQWTIKDEFRKFIIGTGLTEVSSKQSSNLFTQLYYKVRMVSCLRQDGILTLQSGIKFPKNSSKKTIRKIGTNPVVMKAVQRLTSYLEATYYVAIVPEVSATLDRFFKDELAQVSLVDYPEWNVHSYGYLTWSDIKSFCDENRLKKTLRVFELNEGQIY
ncbi:MAG: hypothetical protein DPW09_04510 [Anaerolineae bacterium]|nr:hypothetical protein [Anaerolineales bacterium]MCQ3972693.1 hypothetical protein [Anaerolineae bacterium]